MNVITLSEKQGSRKRLRVIASTKDKWKINNSDICTSNPSNISKRTDGDYRRGGRIPIELHISQILQL